MRASSGQCQGFCSTPQDGPNCKSDETLSMFARIELHQSMSKCVRRSSFLSSTAVWCWVLYRTRAQMLQHIVVFVSFPSRCPSASNSIPQLPRWLPDASQMPPRRFPDTAYTCICICICICIWYMQDACRIHIGHIQDKYTLWILISSSSGCRGSADADKQKSFSSWNWFSNSDTN